MLGILEEILHCDSHVGIQPEDLRKKGSFVERMLRWTLAYVWWRGMVSWANVMVGEVDVVRVLWPISHRVIPTLAMARSAKSELNSREAEFKGGYTEMSIKGVSLHHWQPEGLTVAFYYC